MKAVPLIVLGLWLVAPALAEPLTKGDCWLAPMVATQRFDSKLDLTSGVAFGAPAGFALERRFGLAMDFAQSNPDQKGSSQTARISSLLAIAMVRPVEMLVQPYLLAGFGGILFHYGDTRDSAGSSAAVGGGLEFAATKHARIFAEYYRPDSIE